MRIDVVSEDNLSQAAEVHALSWQESHRAFCTPEFVAAHTPQRQRDYILEKIRSGSVFYLLSEGKPIGVVSVRGNLIEDLYILPQYQNRGYGTKLLHFAMKQCGETPTLWILENNTGAERLYRDTGFRPTGRKNQITGKLDEIELSWKNP